MTEEPAGSEFVCLHALVQGHVQGVGFRYFVQERATALHLTGWVRNLWNGDVEVLAEGRRSTLELLVQNLHRGPRSSYVTGVTEEWSEYSGKFTGFQVRMTS